MFSVGVSVTHLMLYGGKQEHASNKTVKQTRPRPVKIELLPLDIPLLEMVIIRDHLIVPDTGRAKLLMTSQRQPSNPRRPYPSGHPRTATLLHPLPLASHPVLGEDPRPTVNKGLLKGPWTGLCPALRNIPFVYTVFYVVCFLVS